MPAHHCRRAFRSALLAGLTALSTLGIATPAAALVSIAAGPIGYSAWDVTGTDKLVRFDLSTGEGTVLGAIRTAGGTGFSDIDGLAFDAGGRLWAVDDNTDTLLRVDTATGAATSVGSLGITPGDSHFGLAFGAGGTLYMTASDRLYTLDTGTAAATLVGTMGNRVRSLGYHAGTLYGWSSIDTLVTINTTTAATTTVGGFGFNQPTGGRDGMDADPATGMLWGLGDDEARTYTINPMTGMATVIAQQVCVEGGIANPNCSGGGFNGLAISPVPEPASALLLAGGLALLHLGRRRR